MKKVLQLLTLTTLLATSLSAAPIHDAVRAGNLDMVKQMIEENPALVNAKSDGEWTPLHYAAGSNRIKIVELLFMYQANVNAQDNVKQTPLHIAAFSGSIEIVRLLLSYGANVNAQDNWLSTPLHCAVISGHTKIVALLLEAGADVSARENRHGSTPLDIARSFNRAAVIEYLIMIPLLQSLRNLSAPEIVTVQ